MSFLIYLLKAEPLTTPKLRMVVEKHVFPAPHKMMVHPSLPAGHYFLYGCFTCTTFNFPDTLNYSVTQVSQSDFITEITTNATLQALIDRTVWSTDTNNNNNNDSSVLVEEEYYFELVDLLLERRTFTGVNSFEQMAAGCWPHFVQMDVNRPMFFKSDALEDKPFGFYTNSRIDLAATLRDWARLPVPSGQVYFKLSPIDNSTKTIPDHLPEIGAFQSESFKFGRFPELGPILDKAGSDIIMGRALYSDYQAYCAIPMQSIGVHDLYRFILGSALACFDQLLFAPRFITGMLYRSLLMLESFSAELKTYLMINVISNSGYIRLKLITHMLMFSKVNDEEIFYVLKWLCFENKLSPQDISNVRTILSVRPTIRSYTGRVIPETQELPVILRPFASQYRPNNPPSGHISFDPCRRGFTLSEFAGIVDNLEMFKLVYSDNIDMGRTYPSTLDNVLLFTRSPRCVEYLLDNDPGYFKRNPHSRPLWWFGQNFNVFNRDVDRYLLALNKCKKLPGFNSSIPHFPSIEDLCIYSGKLKLLTWMKSIGITYRERKPHGHELPTLCSPVAMVVFGAEPVSLNDYLRFFPPATHHICDISFVLSIYTHGVRSELLSLRFKDSSWPLYKSGTKMPFAAVLLKCPPNDIETMLNVPGLPPVNKLTVNMRKWREWFKQYPFFKAYEFVGVQPQFDQGSLLDVHVLAGRLDVIKHIITRHGVSMVTKQTESLFKLRPPQEQEEIKLLVSNLRSMELLGPTGSQGGGGGGGVGKTNKKDTEVPQHVTLVAETTASSITSTVNNGPPASQTPINQQSHGPLAPNQPDQHTQKKKKKKKNKKKQHQPTVQQQSTQTQEVETEHSDVEHYERTVGKFKFSRKMIIGRGSNGTLVYKGVWCDKVPVAVKEMRKGFTTLINNEVDILIQLTAMSSATDNLVRFFGMEDTEDYIYFATSLCEMSLQELVETQMDRFKSMNKQKLINDIINGVRFLHNNNIIHNDLNPRNILFKDNHLFITDMGLSKMSVETSFAFTHAPSGQGGYYPAEVINNQRKTNSVDIFSLGCLMYYILTDGGHPFGDNLPLRVSKIIFDQFNIQQLTDQPCATDLITQMIAKDQMTRPTINMVINHPFFWDINKRIMFITCVFHTTQNQPHSFLSTIIVDHWNKSIDSTLLDQSKSQYNYNSSKDLIRCIRNTTQHHHQLFKDAQKKTLFFDSQQSAFQYFEQRHPTLIVQLYRRFINTDDAQSDNLRDYFVVS
ncbi:hypothetical protein SAMD00019534_033550 [Acytostelium subglobosum LB1]|uniref:hypothetical protein n=1 Tax=Acytostelium subglobosum LB1 TaxID=1410327 RepID=UPI000644C495|nr:hypothetical protein SAMD00019534_033550 [Acytostelium subglobosum LB1]GAM20180.1 hypothetical protein SAMD00019534_033550 [Acytostelium subglobosum LB1]|eukprot:XP_012759701.1 hypothetical protein SAMD00019534_033550 [Acytostelium subglobosum LB1]